MMSVPISNSTCVWLLPSLAVELIEDTPLIVRTAASTRWLNGFAISVGAALGWVIATITMGSSISGCSCTSMRRNETRPISTRPVNITIGTIGLRIDHAEILRMSTALCPRLDQVRLDRLPRGQEGAGALDD